MYPEWELPHLSTPADAAVTTFTISLGANAAERATHAALRDGVPLSAWLSHAAAEAADLAEGRSTLDDHFAFHGEPTEAVVAEVNRKLAEAGVGRPPTAAHEAARRRALARLRGELPYQPGTDR